MVKKKSVRAPGGNADLQQVSISETKGAGASSEMVFSIMTKHQSQEHDGSSSQQQVELNIKVVSGAVKRFDSQHQKQLGSLQTVNTHVEVPPLVLAQQSPLTSASIS